MTQQILVLPQTLLPRDWISKWPDEDRFRDYEEFYKWLPRPLAEATSAYWQPIPSALLRNLDGEYCVLRRANKGRSDLRRRFTLVVGGHIDESGFEGPLASLLERTVLREMSEEVGVGTVQALSPQGVIADLGAVDGTKHVSFLYEAVINAGDVELAAPEEFSARSKVRVQFLPLSGVRRIAQWLDPWSALILDLLLDPTAARQERFEFTNATTREDAVQAR